MPREQSRWIFKKNKYNNEHDGDSVYVEGPEIVLGSLHLRMVPRSVTQTGTVIINTDPHTERFSHWLAVHFF